MKPVYTFLALCLFAILSGTVSGQVWKWGVQNIGAGTEGWLVAADRFGNSFAAGYFVDSSGISIGTHSFPDTFSVKEAFVARFDSLGNPTWVKGIMNGNSIPVSISAGADGSLYLLAVFDSFAMIDGVVVIDTARRPMRSRFILARFDSSGNFRWVRLLTRSPHMSYFSPASAGGVATDSNGNAYVALPTLDDTASLGTTTLTGITRTALIIKYDTSGSVSWITDFGHPTYADPSAVNVSPAGSVYVTGFSGSGTMTFGGSTVSSGGVFLAKLDQFGNEDWIRFGRNSSSYIPCGLCADKSNNVFITGYYRSTISFDHDTITSTGYGSSYLAKYDSSGNEQWLKNITCTDHSTIVGVMCGTLAIDSCQNVWGCAGTQGIRDTVYFDGHAIVPVIGLSIDPLYLFACDQHGTFLAATTLQSGGEDYFIFNAGIASDSHGNIFISSDFESIVMILGADTLRPGLSEYFYIAKYDPQLSCGSPLGQSANSTLSDPGMLLFPNPACSEITIHIAGTDCLPATACIFDVMGRQYRTFSLSNNDNTINISDMIPGVYYCIVYFADAISVTGKLVKIE